MNEVDKAYCAGLMDGDGCIQISGSFVPRLNRKHIMLGVKVAMQSLPAVEFFAACVGGSTKLHEGPRVYECVIWQRKARDLLEQLLPYLRGKKRQAAFGLFFYDVAFSQRPRGAVKLTDEELAFREVCAEVSSLLNQHDSMAYHGKLGEFRGRLSALTVELQHMFTLSQALEGIGSKEGATTTETSPNSNSPHERPAPRFH